MKKIGYSLLSTLLAATLLIGCGNGQDTTESTTPPESEAAAETDAPEAGDGKLVMATEAGFRPYEYYEGTEVAGVDVDIAREIAAAMGLELVVEDMAFDAIVPAVNSGKADFGAAGLSITEARLKQVDFSIEYATSKQVILVTSDSDIAGEGDLDGKSVGVQLGTVADIVLSEDYPDVAVEPYNKYFEAANDLLAGRIDAIVLDILPAQELAKMDEKLVIRDEELFTDVYAICVKKGNQELLDTINEVLERLLDEGKIEDFTAAHLAE